ncbi:M23 family metallopeptidase [Patescibacteria group bacterium]|nr:M23 family metallopeptidase [Patescibacteria group bacterium]
MKKWLLVSLMVLGVVLLPSSLRAPSTDGHVAAVAQPDLTVQDTTVFTVATVNIVNELELRLPFNVGSRWRSGDESKSGIWWNTNQGEKYFVIEDGQFVSSDSTDTWFIYGWFGSLSAIKEDYNIKYPQWQNRHNGIDFAGRDGIEVTSASDGVVSFAGERIGNTVIVKTGNYQITYGHLQDVSVRVGQQIKAGDLIGHLGNTGTANPHLHFQVDYVDGKTRVALNPVPLINTDWSNAVIPNAPSNSFYSGLSHPALQPNFNW